MFDGNIDTGGGNGGENIRQTIQCRETAAEVAIIAFISANVCLVTVDWLRRFGSCMRDLVPEKLMESTKC